MSCAAVKTSLLVVTVLAILATSAVAAVNLLLDREDVWTYAISETRHYVTQKPTLDRDVSDGVLTLATHCGHALLRCSADLRVTVPAGSEITVQTDSGDVKVGGLSRNDRALRAIDARTDWGDVRLRAR